MKFSYVLIFSFGFYDMCSKIWPYFLHYHPNGFFQRQRWTTNDSNLDIRNVHLLVLAMVTSTPKTKNNGIQKTLYKGMAGNMDYEDQSLLIERARTQSWLGVTQAVFANFGRGLVATRKIVKIEVVIDYHVQIFTKKTMEEVSAIEGIKREYCLEVKGHGRRIINASAEVCPDHPENRCMGRRANHSVAEANIKSANIHLFCRAKPTRRCSPGQQTNQFLRAIKVWLRRSSCPLWDQRQLNLQRQEVYSQEYFPERNLPLLRTFS